jgi:hypothetical protein
MEGTYASKIKYEKKRCFISYYSTYLLHSKNNKKLLKESMYIKNILCTLYYNQGLLRSGCASVFNTNLSREITSGELKSK